MKRINGFTVEQAIDCPEPLPKHTEVIRAACAAALVRLGVPQYDFSHRMTQQARAQRRKAQKKLDS